MRIWLLVILAGLALNMADAAKSAKAYAQDKPRRVALKAGENVELMTVYWVLNCRSVMIGIPEVEILDGPKQMALTIKEAMVLPRRQGCANRVPGGILMATARDVNEPIEGKLTYRLKYKTKDGDRPRAYVYLVSLFP